MNTTGIDWDAWRSAAIAAAGTALLCPFVLGILRRRHVVDTPNYRSSHTRPTPRGGGIALAFPMFAAGLLSRGSWGVRCGLLIPALGLAMLGLADDIRGVPVGWRFVMQLAIGAVSAPFLLAGARVGPVAALAATVIGLIWLVAFVNAFNFMDGINGISAVQAAIAGLAYAWLGRHRVPLLVDGGLIVAGAAVGFLPFNFPRARMFLGDIGSYLLGAWLAVLAVLAIRYRLGPVAAGGPVALYLGDTGTTLLRRIANGEPWRQAHRTHAYQRLVQAGWSHPTVTAVVGAVVAACSILGVIAPGRSVLAQVGLAGVIGALVLSYVAAGCIASKRGMQIAG